MELKDKVKKVLIVDDDLDLLEQNKTLMESKGFSVITADSGKLGFEMFQKEKPDAAIVDLIMEEMDSGFVLCHKIKKTDHGKKIPVFMLTSATYETGFKFNSSTSEEKDWIKCDGFLNKPVVVEELLSKLENYFGL